MKRLTALAFIILLAVGCTSEPPTPLPTATPGLTPTARPAEATQPTEPTKAAEATPPPAQPATEVPAETQAPQPTTGPAVAVSYAGLPLPTDREDFFAGSGVCAVCHTRLTDQAGRDVSIDSYWRSTMMANAARDPYWRATVRAEVLRNPDYRAIIEDKCATCHTPMARFTMADQGPSPLLDDGLFDSGHPLHRLALDGVSCTLCHQIEQEELGQPTSYSGHFVIDQNLPVGERVNYGPFPVSEESANLMQLASGFIPVEGVHIKEAALCATCHTLFTPYLDQAGVIVGEFPEQVPFLEWLYSDYRGSVSCQDCHMPPAEGGVVLSTTGGEPRSPFSQHSFVGGNAFMLTVLQVFAEESAVTAATEHFDATISRVHDQLENRTGQMAIEGARVEGDTLLLDVVISNLAGHKFPSGFPSRRAWLHLTVVDASGATIFESGGYAANGRIVGNDNDDDPGRYEPHYAAITEADQVQIYEAIMQTVEGDLTTTLLRGAGYIKDNRLLPAGFVKGNHLDEVAVHGQAVDDPDFNGGGDRVHFEIGLSGAQGPLTVQVELLYQTVGFRWAQNLADYGAPEIEQFLGYYDAVPNTPLQVASASAQVTP